MELLVLPNKSNFQLFSCSSIAIYLGCYVPHLSEIFLYKLHISPSYMAPFLEMLQFTGFK